MIPLAAAEDSAIVFGQHDHLVGVWSPANDDIAGEPRTAVIMVTAGMIHHSGPFGLHVELARRFKDAGIASLRLDLSGIGESLAVGASGDSLDRAANEIGQAIDYLAEHFGVENVILFGLCSGADDAIHTATVDRRVTGVIAMDGCGYRTAGYQFYRIKDHYLPRIFSAKKWLGLLSRFHRQTNDVPKSMRFGDDIREFPDRETTQNQLRSLIERRTNVHFIYTGGVSDYYNHASQFNAMFPELVDAPEISHTYFADMDHVAFLCEDRDKLIDHVIGRMKAW